MENWLTYAVITTLFWGVWGAFIEVPEKRGFPATLGYVVWSLTMVPCALVALSLVGWKVEASPKAVLLGAAAGLLGAGGQLALFEALRRGPAYLVFPIVSLSPAISVVMAVALLGESTTPRVWTGIVLALVAVPLLSYQPPSGSHGGARAPVARAGARGVPRLGSSGLRAALRQPAHAERKHLRLHDRDRDSCSRRWRCG